MGLWSLTMSSRLALLLLLGIASMTPVFGQVPLNSELVINGDFENLDLSDWTVSQGSVTHTAYSGAFYPGADVSSAMGGGRFMLRGLFPASNRWSSMYQSIDLSSRASEIDNGELVLDYSAWMGGYASDADYVQYTPVFYDGNGTEVGRGGALAVYSSTRNQETTLLHVWWKHPIPAQTRSVLLAIDFRRDSGNSMEGVIDHVSAKIRRTTDRPPAKPYGVNILNDGDFEGRGLINPANRETWQVSRGSFTRFDYGVPDSPSLEVRDAIGGGQKFLVGAGWGSGEWAYLIQRLDLSGNAAEIDAGRVTCELSAWIGGRGSDPDYAQVEIYFEDEGGASIPNTHLSTGGYTPFWRNYRTNMVNPRPRGAVPPGTRTALVYCEIQREDGSIPVHGYVDNVEVTLMLDEGLPPAKPLDTNLLANSSFESEFVLDPNDPGWVMNRGQWQTTRYADPGGPSEADGQAVQGGDRFLQATSWGSGEWAYLYQDIDVRGNAAEIDAGQLWAHAFASLGGRQGDTDYGYLELSFFDSSYSSITLPNASTSWRTHPSWRNYDTVMIDRRWKTLIPAGTRYIRMWVYSQREDGSQPIDFYVDNIRLELDDDERAPAAVPLDTELLHDPGMEGETVNVSGSVRDLWSNYDSQFITVDYDGPLTPSAVFAASVGGGSRLVKATSWRSGNVSSLETYINVAGNAAEIDAGAVAVRLSGLFGGYANDRDDASLHVYAYDEQDRYLNAGLQIGYVSAGDRQNQTILLPREGLFLLPSQTRGIRIRLEMRRIDGGSIEGMADNLSAKLVRPDACGATTCINLSSSDAAWALPVNGTLADQIMALNAGPPAFSSTTWQRPFRKNENGNPALNRAFNCSDPNIIPLNEAFVDASTYLTEADEVTLDNCSSAFYRFTFNMPAGFLDATLYGALNADDQAVIFLNGHRISGEMAANSFGTDVLDANGMRIMTSPTRDGFFTNDPSLFVSGVNELVFAVCGDAGPFDPTGLEFQANVIVDSQADLTIDSNQVSAATGRVLTYFVDAGPGFGSEPYLLMASLAGMWPGMDVAGFSLPLNRDFLFDLTLMTPNTLILGSAGTLSTSGFAFSRWTLPPLPPVLVGTEVSHAAVIGVLGSAQSLISNPVLLTVVP